MKFLLLSLVLASTAYQTAQSAPLAEAQITKIINGVWVTEPNKPSQAANLHDVIEGNRGVRTGVKSRSELMFQDQTLTRLGPETVFNFTDGTRDIDLARGSMLLQVPKGLGGARIRTAAVTAAITGTTIIIEHQPRKQVKVLVLEGSLRLGIDGKFARKAVLRSGQMVVMAPDAKVVPDPVMVDLKRVMKTSTLVNMGGESKPLPSFALVQQAMDDQAKAMTDNRLTATNTFVRGNTFVPDDRVPTASGGTTSGTASGSGSRTPSSGGSAGGVPGDGTTSPGGTTSGSSGTGAPSGNGSGNGNGYGHGVGPGNFYNHGNGHGGAPTPPPTPPPTH